MIIKVTQEDIDKGEREHPCGCPIALAIKRVFPNAEVDVTPLHVIINTREYKLPFNAQHFVYDFDSEKPVEPFEFELEGL